MLSDESGAARDHGCANEDEASRRGTDESILENRHLADEQLAALETERKGIVTGVDETLLSIYERLLKVKGDAAVVPLIDGLCRGCHMKVTTSTHLSAKAEKEITHCEQCGRIVYLES